MNAILYWFGGFSVCAGLAGVLAAFDLGAFNPNQADTAAALCGFGLGCLLAALGLCLSALALDRLYPTP